MTGNTKAIGSDGEAVAQVKLYNEVLVSYDIADTGQRTKLFNKLKDISLTSIQKSVFWGHLNRAEETSVKHLLKIYCAKTDKAFIARVKLSEQIQQNNSVGYEKQDFPQYSTSYHVI
ncbi:CRISPR-associated endonuclease Cas2 [Candidatus Spongiihabitans sp.]|uniref:CRISPR-associated endonuclease Cas2 n=1 Tax=Candidatus Spongiihabitans sp. TaxID=3101308 RepID=UPI003C7ED996